MVFRLALRRSCTYQLVLFVGSNRLACGSRLVLIYKGEVSVNFRLVSVSFRANIKPKFGVVYRELSPWMWLSAAYSGKLENTRKQT